MQMNRRAAWLVLPLAASCLTAFGLQEQDDDIAAVRQAVQYYIDGHATGDPEVMAQAFHPSARLQFIRDGEVSIRSLNDYLGGMRGEPSSEEAERMRRVVMVDVAGAAAVAKIELDYPQVFITDYMQLLKVGGEWKIVNKIFYVQRK